MGQPTQAGIHRRLVVGWLSKGMGIGITFGKQILLVPVFLVLWGPMHLAASVGTPSVSVFSNRAKPGLWFPFGTRNRVFYPGLDWSGGTPPILRDAGGETNITLIPNEAVLEACCSLLQNPPIDEQVASRAASGS